MLRSRHQQLIRIVVYRQRRRFFTSFHRQRFVSSLSSQVPVLGCAVHLGIIVSCTSCETHAISNYPASQEHLEPLQPPIGWTSRLHRFVRRGWRVLLRLIKLTFTLAPVVAFYPILMLTHDRSTEKDTQDIILAEKDEPSSWLLSWYLHLCLTCVEWSGAAVIKLMQWAGSRPDLFGHDFCAVFSQLQDNTTPHRWKHTQRMMREAYGDDWESKIRLGQVVGSGCIGQVYQGQVVKPDGSEEKVAVKVLHPSVEEDIDADLDIMRLAVYVVDKVGIFPSLKWLNLEGLVEEFAGLLKLQLDLRQEAKNLERFNENYKDDENIVFPHLIPEFPSTKNVLVESYLDGIPVLDFARANQSDREMLHDMCMCAIRAVCKMIFLDNFMHGDLHPGNVFVSLDGQKFILFDVGIAAEYSEDDHKNIVDILGSFIRKQGRRAGRLMIDDSNNRLKAMDANDAAVEEEKYIDKIEELTIRASKKGYVMENLGVYISYICNAAADHHIMLNPSFVSAALAVKVQEGIALALDPSIPIWKVATPIIVESERRRRTAAMSKSMGLDRIWSAFNGGEEL